MKSNEPVQLRLDTKLLDLWKDVAPGIGKVEHPGEKQKAVYLYCLHCPMQKGDTKVIRWQIPHSYRSESTGLAVAALMD